MATATATLTTFEPSGFVQLRRGILQHLADGRINTDEFAAYTVLIMKANHCTGLWRGSGRLLGMDLHWCERKARQVLASLTAKGYVEALGSRRGASHWIRISKYFGSPTPPAPPQKVRHPHAEVVQSSASGCRLPQEELLYKQTTSQKPRQTRAIGVNSIKELRDRAAIAARDYRIARGEQSDAHHGVTELDFEGITAAIFHLKAVAKGAPADISKLRDGAGRRSERDRDDVPCEPSRPNPLAEHELAIAGGSRGPTRGDAESPAAQEPGTT